MKVVILAGGFGTRLSEETELRPKPLIEIGGKPILWHVMKIFEAGGYGDFVICCGYKGQLIKSYFVNYFTENYDIMVNLDRHSIEFLGQPSEKWKVTLVDTGLTTMTGGRLRRIRAHLEGEDAFCMTYGDGLSTVDLKALLAFHRGHGKLATLTAINPAERFGLLNLVDKDSVGSFREKQASTQVHVNGGFFVLSPKVLDYIDADDMPWERTPLERLSAEGNLKAFRHPGFWQCMDTLRDKILLEYYRLWRFKHPNANDFMRVAEKVSGLQLDWYKEYWVNTTKTIDYGIDSLWEENGKAKIRLKMVGNMPMPIDVLVQYKDGSKELAYIPQYLQFGSKPVEDPAIPRTSFEPWRWTHPTYTFELNHRLTDLKIVEIDPTQRMADVDRKNNKLELNW